MAAADVNDPFNQVRNKLLDAFDQIFSQQIFDPKSSMDIYTYSC